MPISMCVAWFSPSRQLVADDRPRRFLRDDRLDAELLEVAELVRHHDRRAVGERDDAEAHRRRLGAVVRRRRRRPSPAGRPASSTPAADVPAVLRNGVGRVCFVVVIGSLTSTSPPGRRRSPSRTAGCRTRPGVACFRNAPVKHVRVAGRELQLRRERRASPGRRFPGRRGRLAAPPATRASSAPLAA